MSNFINDFLAYNVGTECPTNYLRWSAISALAIAAGRRFILRQGRLMVRPNLYIALIGEQGNRKSFAKDQTRDLITEALVDYPVSADITSRDDLIKLLASDKTCRFYVTHERAETEWHPVACCINELKHFLSYLPSSMISFIVDIFDRPIYKCSTIKRGVEEVPEPCLNILACETPDWMIENLKLGIITGGFGRRFIIVYETEGTGKPIALPYLPSDADTLWRRMKDHLALIYNMPGQEFKWEPDAQAFFVQWYETAWRNRPDDPLMRGFMRTKDQMVLKVTIALALAEYKPSFVITKELIVNALMMFAGIEPNMPRLYIAAGRNELAVPQQRLMELLERNDGWLLHKDLMIKVDKDLDPREQVYVLSHLRESGRVVKEAAKTPDGKMEYVIATPDAWKKIVANKGYLPARNGQ